MLHAQADLACYTDSVISHLLQGDSMRLAVLSDIHGNAVAFETVLADLEKLGGFDLLWFLGDLAAFGTRPAECVARVRGLIEKHGNEKVQVIGGNTDRYLVTGERMPTPPAKDEAGFSRRASSFTERDTVLNWNLSQLSWADYEFLKSILGRELWHEVPGYGAIIGVHAVPGADEPNSLRPDSPDEEALDALLDREGRLALAGHTHLCMDRQIGRWRVINPGSVGLSFSNPGKAEWAMLTFEGDNVQVDLRAVPYDVDAAIADASAAGYPDAAGIAKRLRPA